jgi:RNA polymerase sigma factor (TIGR02999 family)
MDSTSATEPAPRASRAGATVRAQLDELVPALYAELRRIAERSMRRERAGHALDAPGLVSEAYLRLAEQSRTEWRSREHVLAAAAQVMRRILVDHARSRGAQKRGGDAEELPLDEEVAAAAAAPEDDVDLGALDEALARLARLDGQAVRVVELRYFAGLTLEETAEALGISTATVKRDWAMARAWLYRELTGAAAGGAGG